VIRFLGVFHFAPSPMLSTGRLSISRDQMKAVHVDVPLEQY
jgi:hypothetical protein